MEKVLQCIYVYAYFILAYYRKNTRKVSVQELHITDP